MKRAIVVCLDALRPGAITENAMPNLHRFRQRSLTFTRHRAIFPSDTRPNAAALVTGASCGVHGVNGNAFIAETNAGPMVIDTGSAHAIEQADKTIPGGFYRAPTLGRVLSKHGKSLAVVSSASSGTTRLLHHEPDLDHICVYAHDDAVSLPRGFGAKIAERFGPPPAVETPDIRAVTYGLDAFFGSIWPDRQPEVTLFWFNEPDIIYHAYGPFSAEAAEALKALDHQIGRLIDWWESEGLAAGVQLTIISDHGQIPTSEAVDVIGQMREAGFDAGNARTHQGLIKVVPGGFVQIFDSRFQELPKILSWLQEQPWCGLTFVRSHHEGNVKSAFPLSVGLYDNVRAADVVFTFRDRIENGQSVVPYFAGSSYLGMHGGLNPGETNAVCMIAGPGIEQQSTLCDTPSNTSDIMPTMLAGLGISHTHYLTGRILIDPVTGRANQPGWASELLEAGHGRYRQILHRFKVGSHIYVDSGVSDRM